MDSQPEAPKIPEQPQGTVPPVPASPVTPEIPVKKPRLPRLVRIFSFLFFVPLIFLLAIGIYLWYLASHGTSGTEYIAIVLAPVTLITMATGLIYAVLLVLYAFSKHSSRRGKIISIIIVVMLLGFYGISALQSLRENHKINQGNKPLSDAAVIKLINDCSVESVQKDGNKVDLLLTRKALYDKKGNYKWEQSSTASAEYWDAFVDAVKKAQSKCGGNVDAIDARGPHNSWISVQQATEILQKCEVRTFNYSASGLKGMDGKPPVGQPTGIILAEQPTFSHLYIEQSQEAVMIPIARSVQAQCKGPQFYHDGNYEQQQADGSWYQPGATPKTNSQSDPGGVQIYNY